MAEQRITLANCTAKQMKMLKDKLHPVTDRRTLIFAAGALNNQRLLADLGSQESAQWQDGAVAAGHLPHNTYWPDQAKGTRGTFKRPELSEGGKQAIGEVGR